MSTKTSNGVADCGATFVIVPETKQVKVPPTHKIIGAVGDHLAEQITFECPKTIDGYDVSQCMRKYITWQNVAGEIGHDELTVATGGKEGCVRLKWTIRGALTTAMGLVKFSVHFENVAEDGETVLYRWSTTVCQNCEILDSINAVLATYANIYVAGDTLVLADYTPVTDGTLALETPGIVPEGTVKITENGVHDVGQYAAAEVEVYPAPQQEATVTVTNVPDDYPAYAEMVPIVSVYVHDHDGVQLITKQLYNSVLATQIQPFTASVGSLVYIVPAENNSQHMQCVGYSGGEIYGLATGNGDRISPVILRITDTSVNIRISYI